MLRQLNPGGKLSEAKEAAFKAAQELPVSFASGDPATIGAALDARVTAAAQIEQNQQDVMIEGGRETTSSSARVPAKTASMAAMKSTSAEQLPRDCASVGREHGRHKLHWNISNISHKGCGLSTRELFHCTIFVCAPHLNVIASVWKHWGGREPARALSADCVCRSCGDARGSGCKLGRGESASGVKNPAGINQLACVEG